MLIFLIYKEWIEISWTNQIGIIEAFNDLHSSWYVDQAKSQVS